MTSAEAREKVRHAIAADVMEYQLAVVSHSARMATNDAIEAALDAYRDAVRAEAFAEMRAEMVGMDAELRKLAVDEATARRDRDQWRTNAEKQMTRKG